MRQHHGTARQRICCGILVGLLLFIVPLLVATLAPRAVALPFVPVQAQSADDAAALRALAERLLAPAGVGPDGQPSAAHLLPGALPDDLPLALPTPPNGQLVGSVVRRAGTRSVSWDIVFDAPASFAELSAFYQQALVGQGWTPAPMGPRPQPGGFQSSLATTSGTFCQKTTGPSLALSVIPQTGAPADVRVHVDTNANACASQPGPNGAPPTRLPALAAPPGVSVQQYGGGYGGPRYSSDAMAATTISAGDLEASYAAQLQAAGWTRVGGNIDGPLAWSTWTVAGEGDYQGFLYVLAVPGQARRSLHVEAVTPSGTSPFSPGAVGDGSVPAVRTNTPPPFLVPPPNLATPTAARP